jgi:hypothetical protein
MGLAHLTVVETGAAHRTTHVTKDKPQNEDEDKQEHERNSQDPSQPDHEPTSTFLSYQVTALRI